MPPKLVRKPTRIGAYEQGGIGVVDGLTGVSGDFPRLIEVGLDAIRDNPDQPRTVFDEEALRSLADSIARHGLQQPILVAELPERGVYRLVAGERRLLAHRMLGRATIFAIITAGKPEEISIIENVLREDLDAVDFARGLERLIDIHGYTHDALGALIGKDATVVTKSLAVLRLPSDILADYQTNRARLVSASVLREIAEAGEEPAQRRLWRKASEGLTVKQLRVAKKAEAAGETDDALALRVAKSVKTIGREVEALKAARDGLSAAHRSRLAELHAEIGRLLAGD